MRRWTYIGINTGGYHYSKAHKFVYCISLLTMSGLNSMHAVMVGTGVCLYYIHVLYYIRVYYKRLLLYSNLPLLFHLW